MSTSSQRSGWQREFKLIWIGSVTSQLGSMTTAVASPLLALALSGSAIFAGWVSAASTLPGVLLQMPAGLLVDRIRHKRRLMVASQTARLCSATILLLGLLLSDSPHIFLLVAVTVDGICTTFYNLAEITMIRNLVPEKDRSSAATKDEVRSHISQVAGRSLGGYLFGLSQAFPYLFDAVASASTLIILNFVGKNRIPDGPGTPDHRPKDRPVQRLAAGWKIVWNDLYLRCMLLVCATANLLFQVTILLLLVWAKKANYSSSEIGILLAGSGLFGIIGSVLTEKWLMPMGKRAVWMTLACFCSWVILMACVWGSPFPALGLMFWGLFSTVGAYINIALRCHQTAHVPAAFLGRVTSIGKFITSGATPVGALIAGYAIHWFNRQTIMLIATAAMFAVVLMTVKPLTRGLHPVQRDALETGETSIEPRPLPLPPLGHLPQSWVMDDDQNRSSERLVFRTPTRSDQ